MYVILTMEEMRVVVNSVILLVQRAQAPDRVLVLGVRRMLL